VLWFVVFVGIALAGVAMLVGYAIWLAHKTADVLSELNVLGERAGELADLLGEIGAGGAASAAEAAVAPAFRGRSTHGHR
jgi:hypothetical protein